MITIEAPGATLTVRAAIDRVDRTIERTAESTPAGELVVLGDGGWNPARLSLSFRVASTTVADAVAERNAAMAIVTKATAVHVGGRVTYVAGVQAVTVRLRGVWWEFSVAFAPRALTDTNEGTGEPLTHSGVLVTFGGVALTVEVH